MCRAATNGANPAKSIQPKNRPNAKAAPHTRPGIVKNPHKAKRNREPPEYPGNSLSLPCLFTTYRPTRYFDRHARIHVRAWFFIACCADSAPGFGRPIPADSCTYNRTRTIRRKSRFPIGIAPSSTGPIRCKTRTIRYGRPGVTHVQTSGPRTGRQPWTQRRAFSWACCFSSNKRARLFVSSFFTHPIGQSLIITLYFIIGEN